MSATDGSLRRDALVIVPTYNERDNVAEIVRRLMAATRATDVLFVDDSSPDGTALAIESLVRDHEHVHILQRPCKMGLGTAYVAGFRWGLERGYRTFVEMDADGSHDPADVPRLLEALREADLVIGSRYVDGGRVENWGLARRRLSRFANAYARLLLGYEIRDSTAGFRAFAAETLLRIDFRSLASEGYGFQIEATYRVHRAGGRMVEVPIAFSERAQGRSKMGPSIIVEAMVNVIRWAVQQRLERKSHNDDQGQSSPEQLS